MTSRVTGIRIASFLCTAAFPATVLSGLILTADLRRPLRFWHMLIQSDTGRLMFKAWSPMSVGSWALLIFGAFTLVSLLAAIAESGRLRARWPVWFRPPSVLGSVFSVVGGLFGFFIAGYTGVLLATTNRPIWSDTTLLGLVFLVSAASTSAALLVLLTYGRPLAVSGIHALERFDSWMLVLELITIIALVGSLGSLARLWLNVWGALLIVGVVIVGILVPLILAWRPRAAGGLTTPASAVLVLIGGFILRVVIVMSSEGV